MPHRTRSVTKGSNGSVTWKWMAVAAFGILVTAGGGWLTYMQSQVTGTYLAIDKTKEKVADQATDQAVTKSKVQDIDRKVDDVRKDVGDIKQTLQQILINQQQQIRDAPKR